MTISLLSTLGESLRDPELRRWKLGRLRGRWASPPRQSAQPDYLAELPAVEGRLPTDPGFAALPGAPPANSAALALPGETVMLSPGETTKLFGRRSAATRQAIDAFAWLPLQSGIAVAWVEALWQEWQARHGDHAASDVAWRPEVAALRAVNLLDYARRIGLPGPRQRSLAVLAAHGPVIAAGLARGELTGSDRALAGHALYRLGVDLGLPGAAEQGAAVLQKEARDLFRPSGMLGDDSIGWHLRLTQVYADAWLAARRHQRPEAPRLEETARAALGVIPALSLSGGLPAIGEDAADMPLSFLAGLRRGAPADSGWTGLLPAEEREALLELRDGHQLHDLEQLRAEGWLRFDAGRWNGLWHGAVEGWSSPHGHGHEDLGSCELHYNGVPVFVDPGTAAPGVEADLADLYRSALAHNALTLDGRNPYPSARACYPEAFRRSIGGPPPCLQAEHDGVTLHFNGYDRLGGPRGIERRWTFTEGGGLTIDDTILGTGRYRVERRLITPLNTMLQDGAAVIEVGAGRLRVAADLPAELHQAVRWNAAGDELPLTVILFGARTRLPWRGKITAQWEG